MRELVKSKIKKLQPKIRMAPEPPDSPKQIEDLVSIPGMTKENLRLILACEAIAKCDNHGTQWNLRGML
jgi:hypothetical protein